MDEEALGAKIRLERGAVLTKLDQHSVWLSFNEELVDAAIRRGCDTLKAIEKDTGLHRSAISRHYIPQLQIKRGLKSKPYRYD